MNRTSQLQFTHRAAILLESGISLSETLSIIIRMEKSDRKRKALSLMKKNVDKGVSLSKSMLLSKIGFDSSFISIVSHGESSGILALSLRQAREIMEKRNGIEKKIFGALMYPAFIALSTIAMTLFLVMYIFPKIIPLFSSMNITLPLLTRAVRKLYEILLHYGLWISVVSFIIISCICFLYLKKDRMRYLFQMFMLNIPMLGEVLKKYLICGYCRSAGTLLDCGQSLPAILGQNADSSSFMPYKKAWALARVEVERGISLSDCLRQFGTIFPSIVPDMLSIGERTGSLSSMFHHVSRMYEEELDDFIKKLSTIIEPVLMIVMGLVVGSVALSIILPIYEITNHLSK